MGLTDGKMVKLSIRHWILAGIAVLIFFSIYNYLLIYTSLSTTLREMNIPLHDLVNAKDWQWNLDEQPDVLPEIEEPSTNEDLDQKQKAFLEFLQEDVEQVDDMVLELRQEERDKAAALIMNDDLSGDDIGQEEGSKQSAIPAGDTQKAESPPELPLEVIPAEEKIEIQKQVELTTEIKIPEVVRIPQTEPPKVVEVVEKQTEKKSEPPKEEVASQAKEQESNLKIEQPIEDNKSEDRALEELADELIGEISNRSPIEEDEKKVHEEISAQEKAPMKEQNKISAQDKVVETIKENIAEFERNQKAKESSVAKVKEVVKSNNKDGAPVESNKNQQAAKRSGRRRRTA